MKKLLGLSVLVILLMTACDDEEPVVPEPGDIKLTLLHSVDDQNLQIGEERIYMSPVGHPFSVSRLKYYVSNFSFHKNDGSKYDTDIVHYREEGIEDTKSFILEKVPSGEYDKISFIYGLDEATNVDGGLENTLTNQNMIWPIPGDQGYHYMKFEGRYDSLSTGVILNFNLHTGATQNNQNYVEITLDLPNKVIIDNNTWEIDLVMDMMEWLQNPTDYDFAEFGQAIMMNQNAQEVLKANGTDVWSVDRVAQQ